MNLAEYDYQVWRKALHDLQVKIDNFDNDFWESVVDNEGNIIDETSFQEKQTKHDLDRQKLVDELEAHFQSQPTLPS